jgi:serine/threonine-protein kinase
MVSAGSSGVAASLGIEIGDIIAEKYRIEAVLGAGGMGVVFAARHIALNGQFALKFLSSQALSNAHAVGRFYREAQAAVKLRSEHAVRVFDVGTHESGLPYMVMEYLEGGDLGRLLQTRVALSVAESIDYVVQTCAAIADAHNAGIIHRDIKPSNLFCVTRQDKSLMIKVLDFGISKVADALVGEQGITATGNFLGSPSYMSPEQMRAPDRVDHRSDIWSLGVVLYECLTGKLPFPASTLPEICLRVAQDPPIAPSSYRADLPAGLEAVILRCLEKDREARFPSASALAEALSSFQARQPSGALSHAGIGSNAGRTFSAPTLTARVAAGSGTSTLTEPSWVRTAATAVGRRRPVILALIAATLVVAVGVLAGLFLHTGAKLRTDVSAALPAPSASAAPNVAHAPIHAPLPQVEPTPPTEAAAATARPQVTAVATARASAEPAPLSVGSARASSATPTKLPNAQGAAPPLPPTPKPAVERDAKSSVWKR